MSLDVLNLQRKLYLCWLRVDSQWKTIYTDIKINGVYIRFDDFAFHNGRLHAAFKVSGSSIQSSSNILAPTLPTSVLGHCCSLVLPSLNRDKYLVDSGGEPLLVRQFNNQHIWQDVAFQVFKLEERGGTSKVQQLKELGERVLLMGRRCSLSWSSAHSQLQSDFFKNNCINFFYQSECSDQYYGGEKV